GRQAADRTAPRHQHLLAEHGARSRHRVQRHRERLRECSFVQWHIGLHRKNLLLRDDNLIAERTLDMWKSHRAAVETHIETLIRMSFDAIAAVTARMTRVDGNAIADFDTCNTLADLDHNSRDLVSKD